jgi:hypothetical protein
MYFRNTKVGTAVSRIATCRLTGYRVLNNPDLFLFVSKSSMCPTQSVEWILSSRENSFQFQKFTLHQHPRVDLPSCLPCSVMLFHLDSEAFSSLALCTMSRSYAWHATLFAQSYNRTLLQKCTLKFLVWFGAD